MNPFNPPPLPPEDLSYESVVRLVGDANAALARYDGMLEGLINPEVMLSPLVMKEAELSSRIEGTIATASDVYLQQAGNHFDPDRQADIGEILNYRAALRDGSDWVQSGGAITLHVIRQMHETLMRGVRGERLNPGKFRETQNWIGPKGCAIEDATYVPPAPIRLTDHLGALEAFMDGHPQIDPIVKAALIHAQFELIHPFDDGNGRVGRLLIPLFLVRAGRLVTPSFYISAYLERHRDEYAARLGAISTGGDWLGWIRFFLLAVVEQAIANANRVREISGLYSDMKDRIVDVLHTDQAIYLLDFFFAQPIFAGPDLHEALGISRHRASGYIRGLCDAGILRTIRPQSGRTPSIISFDSLWEITDRQ